ncbi:MAG TPA: helix-turn-helix domain-containing protein [Armatimonadota bacterium]|jgi:DNA-binding transcriptional regulator YiaG
MSRLCAECGKRAVEPLAKAGRRTLYRNFPDLEIPADLEIPTCSNCGAEWIDSHTAARIDAALAKVAAERLGKLAREAIETLTTDLSQTELEKQLGLSAGYLSKVKRGRESPSAQLVGLLALLASRPRRLAQLEYLWQTGELPPRITRDHITRPPSDIVSNEPVAC